MAGKTFPRLAVVAGLLVAVIALGGCSRATVPDVVGNRQDEAVRALQEAGYLLGDVSFVATTTVPLGMIAATQPPAGERLKEGEPVSIAIASFDGSRVLVPTLTGLSQLTAENAATTLSLTPVVVEQYSDQPTGEVFDQVPVPGSEVDANSQLVLLISKGAEPEKTEVPDVTGDSESDATAAIEGAGLDAQVYKVYSDSIAKGEVIGQVPDPGKSVSPGSDVQIAVSLGKGTGSVKVPAVTNKTQSDAESALASAGFKVRVVSQSNDDVDKGRVYAQFPSSGATAAKGSEVLIAVSTGAPASESGSIPDVVGMTRDEAAAALTEAGFTADVETVVAEGGAGVVVYQFPAAGTSLASGSDVLAVITEAP